MTAEPTQEHLEAQLPAEVLRSEVNLLLLPFFALSRKELANKDQTVYSTHMTRDGERVEVTWKVSRSINYRREFIEERLKTIIRKIKSILRLPESQATSTG